MAHAIREITIERGHDPRRAVLMPFGGAGPLFATLLARELEMHEIVVPPYAGNFSAWGLLGADLTQTAARTRITPLSTDGLAQANALLAELFAELDARVGADGNGARAREIDLDMRYVGQEHSLTVRAGSDEGRLREGDELRGAFAREYERTYRHTMDEPVEIVNVRATVRTPLARRADFVARSREASAGRPDVRAYSFERGEWLDFAVVERESLAGGTVVAGPAIVLEETATTYLDAGFTARVDSSGCLFVSDRGEER
jgi:N-methylhydantoinase A